MPVAPWPPGFTRVPDEEWTRAPVDTLAQKYDSVENHGWYSNLDPTVAELGELLVDGAIAVDYSGGTGILIDRAVAAFPERSFGVVNADSSPKFLRLSLEKLRGEERVAFRLIRFLKAERRLQLLDEVLAGPLLERGVDVVVSTNAIHLYFDLVDTLRAWRRVLRPGGRVLAQSGNVRSAGASADAWIIDDTVRAVEREARAVVREEPRFEAYRDALDDAARLAAHDAYRDRVFLPARPLAFYLSAFEEAGLRVISVRDHPVEVRVEDWFEFLSVYHDSILGWVGGSEKVEGNPASAEAVRDRLDVMRHALARAVGGRARFEASWTYVTCERPA